MKQIFFYLSCLLIGLLLFSNCTVSSDDLEKPSKEKESTEEIITPDIPEEKIEPVEYTVEHYLQTEDRKGFTLVSEDTTKLKGKPNTLTQAKANKYDGYSVLDFEQEPIKADGSTIIKLYYYIYFLIDYDLGGGNNSSNNPLTYTDKDLPLKLEKPSKDGYLFFAWISSNNEIVTEITKCSSVSTYLKALWYKEGEAYYIVNHNVQSTIDATSYPLLERQYLTGNINSQTNAIAKNYLTGFSNKSFEQQNIANDHSTVINIYYDRNTYTIRIIANYDDRKDYSEFELSGLYYDEVTIPEDKYNSDYYIDKTPARGYFVYKQDATYTISLKSKYKYTKTPEKNNTVSIPMICRDFISRLQTGSGNGYITKEIVRNFGSHFEEGKGHPDFEPTSVVTSDVVKGIVKDRLQNNGLPEFNSNNYITKNSFNMWYTNITGINYVVNTQLTLQHETSPTNSYRFASSEFFPLDNKGFGNTPNKEHNFSFTDEMSFYFLYTGDGTITCIGDDDIWIFVNGILAIDLGGCHPKAQDSISLTGDSYTETIDGKTYKYKYNSKLEIAEGQFVEVKIFHAERRANYSNFELTLEGFDLYEKMPR